MSNILKHVKYEDDYIQEISDKLEFTKNIIQNLNLNENNILSAILNLNLHPIFNIDDYNECYKFKYNNKNYNLLLSDDRDSDINRDRNFEWDFSAVIQDVKNKYNNIILQFIDGEGELLIKIIYNIDDYLIELFYDIVDNQLLFSSLSSNYYNDSPYIKLDISFSSYGIKINFGRPNLSKSDKKNILSPILNILNIHNLLNHEYLEYFKEYNS